MPYFLFPRASQSRLPKSGAGAFTLIELLIVVAIISILAAIAVPNFLEAQTRAKAAAAKANMRTLTTAIESYRVDNQNYPLRRNTRPGADISFPTEPEYSTREAQMSKLTTPIAYITNFPIDVFEKFIPQPHNIIDYYDPTQASWLFNFLRYQQHLPLIDPGWMLVSVGPDGYLGAGNITNGWPINTQDPNSQYSNRIVYDPTNGSVSLGNIYSGQNGGTEGFPAYFSAHINP